MKAMITALAVSSAAPLAAQIPIPPALSQRSGSQWVSELLGLFSRVEAMLKGMIAALVVVVVPMAPGTAQTPAAAPVSAGAARPTISDPQAAAAWVARLADAMKPQTEALGRLNESQAVFATIGTPAGLRAQGPKLKAMLAEGRAGLQRSAALLGAMPAPGFTWSATLKPERLVADAKAYNSATLRVLGDFEAFFAAAERGDRPAMGRLAPRLVEGGFVLIDGKALLLRGRQAALPASQSVHQLLGLSAELSEAMAVSGRAWLTARAPAKAESAAATLRQRLGERATAVRTAVKAGRDNLARERSDIEKLVGGGALTTTEQGQINVINSVFAGKEQMFDVGEAMAALLERSAKIGGTALAAQQTPELVAQLSAFEVQLEHLSLAQAEKAGALNRR